MLELNLVDWLCWGEGSFSVVNWICIVLIRMKKKKR